MKNLDFEVRNFLWYFVSNATTTNESARIAAMKRNDLRLLEAYVKRADTDIFMAMNVIREVKKNGLWKIIYPVLNEKAKLFLKGKTPIEKLESARKINSPFFWNLVLREKDVKTFTLRLPTLSAILFPQKWGCRELWDLIFQNKNIIRLIKMKKEKKIA